MKTMDVKASNKVKATTHAHFLSDWSARSRRSYWKTVLRKNKIIYYIQLF